MATATRYLKVLAAGLVVGITGTVTTGLVLLIALMALKMKVSPEPHRHRLPDGPTLVERVRETARLQTLDVRTHKKLTYEVDPQPSESFIGGVASWVAFSADPPVGRAIVFADVHIGFDLSKLDEESLRVDQDNAVVEIVLPPIVTTVEVLPGETEVIQSNLDSQDTAELLDRGKWAIQRDVAADPALAEKARASARAALTNLLLPMGFREVRFVDALEPLPAPSPVPAT